MTDSAATEALWLRNPLAVLGDAPGGIVVRDGRIAELVPAGGARRVRRRCSRPVDT